MRGARGVLQNSRSNSKRARDVASVHRVTTRVGHEYCTAPQRGGVDDVDYDDVFDDECFVCRMPPPHTRAPAQTHVRFGLTQCLKYSRAQMQNSHSGLALTLHGRCLAVMCGRRAILEF